MLTDIMMSRGLLCHRLPQVLSRSDSLRFIVLRGLSTGTGTGHGSVTPLSVSTAPGTSSAVPNRPTNSIIFRIKVLGELSKFRLSSLVVATTGAGYLAAGIPTDLYAMSAACIGTALCAASASTFNQVLEKDIDLNMRRTLARPLPSGKVSSAVATGWGGLWGISGVGLLYFATNPATALLGAGNIVLYAGIYTYLKRYSELNTWVGSIVGAVPPVVRSNYFIGSNYISTT